MGAMRLRKRICIRTENEALELLAAHGLRNDLSVVFESIPGTGGGYEPAADRLRFPSEGVSALTVLHEGAHAMHWRILGWVGEESIGGMDPSDVVGMALASELYVGWRLRDVPGFVEQERLRNLRHGNYRSLVETHRLVDVGGLPDRLYQLPGMRDVMLAPPVLGVETVTGLDFFADLGSAIDDVTYAAFLMHIAHALSGADVHKREQVVAFGRSVADQASRCGFAITRL
jgi:hypothetical protein